MIRIRMAFRGLNAQATYGRNEIMANTGQSHVLDMTKGSPMRLLLRFALPLFFGNLLQQCYNLADTAIAGHLLGDAALAQIGATAALYSLIMNFAFGLNNGMALTVGRSFGAGNREKMRQSICWMVTLAVAWSIFLTILFLGIRRPLLVWLQVPAETLDGALQYLTVILAGIPLTIAYNMESAMLQSVGDSILPLRLLLFSSVLNIGLDFLFMGPLGLGVRGAAVATVASQGISAVLGAYMIIKNHPELHFSGKDRKSEPEFVCELFVTGLSMAMMSTLYNLGSVIMQGSINALGNVYIAAQVGGRRLAELFYIPGLALGTSTATYVSQNYGAGKHTRIMRGIRIAIFLYGIWWLAALIFVIFAAPQTVRLITGSDSAEVIENAAMYLRISIPMMPPMGVLIILRNALQGMRHMLAPLFCSALELIGKVIFSLWIIPVKGYFAVCICEPVTWVICCAFILGALFLFRGELRTDAA